MAIKLIESLVNGRLHLTGGRDMITGGDISYTETDELVSLTESTPGAGVYFKNYGGVIVKRDAGLTVKVDEFGALGNYDKEAGTGTDDSDAIQKAVVYLIFMGGGVLRFTPGKNYLITDTVYINSGGFRPVTIDTGLRNLRNSDAKVNGATLVRTTPGDIFAININPDGTGFNGSTAQYHSFSARGINAIATVSGVNLFKMFRTCSNIEYIATDGLDWVVLQENTDSGSNGNYCDKTTIKNIKCGNPRIGALRLCKPDATSIDSVWIEGDAFNYQKGIEIVTCNSIKISNVLQWFASGSDAGFVPLASSALFNIVNCGSVSIDGVYVEHSPHENVISLSGCIGVDISRLYDKFSRRIGVNISGATKGVTIRNWKSESDILSSAPDIRVAAASVPISDIFTDKCYFKSYTGSIDREINISQNDLNSVRKNQSFKKTFLTVTDSVTLTPNSSLILGTPTANKVLTLPPFENNLGSEITIYNRNTGTFNWSFNLPVKDQNGNDFTILRANTVLTLECSNITNNGWRLKIEYTDPISDVFVPGNADYTITKPNSSVFLSTQLTADRILTLPLATINRGKRISIYNSNTSSFKWNTDKTLVGLGYSLNAIPSLSTVALIADGTNWRIESLLNSSGVITGTFTVTGSGQATINIPHNLGVKPGFTNVSGKSAVARTAGITSWTEDTTNIILTITTPNTGGSLVYSWEARV